MYKDDDLLQLSGLQHLLYCPRQCALAYMELEWEDNYFTAVGVVMHENVHSEKIERRKNVVVERDIYLKSYQLGLVGKSDVVEFHRHGTQMVPFPIEYKSGKPKADDVDKVQLCAQALCLEEMMNLEVPSGAIFYGKTRNRLDVVFDKDLRGKTSELALEFHHLIESKITPKPHYSSKCDNCSFKDICLPGALSGKKTVNQYLRDIIDEKIV